jgi:hypothetical protein
VTQHRYFDFGIFATASTFKEMFSGLTGKTVLSGGEIGVSAVTPPTQPDRIVIQPVWISLDSPRTTQQGTMRAGVLLHEDEPKQLVVPITSAAANYTVVYRHTDSDVFGGNAATLTLDYGLLQNQNINDGIVLGYVLYPGGGVGLADTMIVPAPKARIEAFSSPADGTFLTPPFTSMIYKHTEAGLAPVVETVDHTSFGHIMQIVNNGNTPTIDRFRWAFIVGREQPRNITFDYVQETGQIITLDIEDSDGNVSATWGSGTVLPSMLTSDFTQDYVLQSSSGQQLRRKRLRITNGTFTPGKRFRVQATIQTAANKRTLVASVGHSTYRQPFAG